MADNHDEIVKVIKFEEKGSDVNLAVHLLHDAHNNKFDRAAIVSLDTDLLEAINIVKSELGKKVGIIYPARKNIHTQLNKAADFLKQVRPGVLRSSQFPDELSDDKGTFHKPPDW